jgi:hypothetical protein
MCKQIKVILNRPQAHALFSFVVRQASVIALDFENKWGRDFSNFSLKIYCNKKVFNNCFQRSIGVCVVDQHLNTACENSNLLLRMDIIGSAQKFCFGLNRAMSVSKSLIIKILDFFGCYDISFFTLGVVLVGVGGAMDGLRTMLSGYCWIRLQMVVQDFGTSNEQPLAI